MCKAKAPPPPKFSDPRQNDPKYQQVGREIGISSISNADQIYQVEKTISERQQAEYQANITRMEQEAASQRAADQSRADLQFKSAQEAQERQFQQAQAAQERALAQQLAAQAEMQRKAEESALRAQVPAMTNSNNNARRVKAASSTKQQARRASMGTSQLRIPLGIGSGNIGTSPVKLNIGS